MDKTFKWLAFIGLLLTALVASCFMAFEAGQFYQHFYPEQIGFIQMGFLAAFLNEIFMAIMAGVWLPQIQFAKLSFVHPANILFKFLLILLFCVSVGGAAFHAVQPRLAVLQKQSNDSSLLQLLNKEQKQSEHNMQVFANQKQRLNAALTAKSQRESQQTIHQVVLRHKSSAILWFEVALMILLRIVVQMANLSSVWLAGWIYRSQAYNHRHNSKNKQDKIASKEKRAVLVDKKQDKPVVIEKTKQSEEIVNREKIETDKTAIPFAQLQSENRDVATKASSNLSQAEVKEQASLRVTPQSNTPQAEVKEQASLRVTPQSNTPQAEVKEQASLRVTPQSNTPQAEVKEQASLRVTPQSNTPQAEVKEQANLRVTPQSNTSQSNPPQAEVKAPEKLNQRSRTKLTLTSEEKDKLQEMQQYIQGIQKLFEQRSEGVQIADICRSINENEAYVRKIIAARDIRLLDEIKAIHRKLKDLREQHLAIG